MPELLIEILTEEIPARMQARAALDFLRLATERLGKSGLEPREALSFVTPRRLAFWAEGIPATQAALVEERRGPRVGAPDAAIQGFLKSTGIASLQDCESRDTGKGIFYFARIRRQDRPTSAILPELLVSLIADFPWPRSMRFPAAPFRWIRPIASVLSLFDGAVMALDLGTIPVADETRGHRFLAPGKFIVRDFPDYRRRLREAYVILDAKDRRQAIGHALDECVGKMGLTLKDDPALLDEVTGLVEWPVVLSGRIDSEFMDLPPEVLTTSMRAHQKYFSCLDRNGALAPRFLFVANNLADDDGKAIVAGNERVLRARLSDARFFWNQDRSTSLASRLPKLGERVFHARLGTLLDKVRRMMALAEAFAPYIPGAEPFKARRAAELSKADLSTGMVGEFPELQGVMGRYYATHDGEDPEVAVAIAEHYSPVGPNDRCPTAPVSVVVALADKIDTLIGFFAVGEIPSGSKDPYALRRAALGVIRLVLENDIHIGLKDAFHFACDPSTGITATAETINSLIEFFVDRLKVHLRERGVRHDLIAAVFALGEDDLVRLVRRVEALDAFLATEDGVNLLTAYRRASNIVAIEEKAGGVAYDAGPESARLEEEEERVLMERLDEAADRSADRLAKEDFSGAMTALATLRRPIDHFFARVVVNVENPELRANRLRLLARIRSVFDRLADFSKVEGPKGK
jgi:glycyl-tRNA synthetase beta chain